MFGQRLIAINSDEQRPVQQKKEEKLRLSRMGNFDVKRTVTQTV
jgi:hypothetical protein